MSTTVEVRTRNRIPRRIRAGVQFGPRFAEHELTDKQLKAVEEDSFLEVKQEKKASKGKSKSKAE